jgi:hypothetical protein
MGFKPETKGQRDLYAAALKAAARGAITISDQGHLRLDDLFTDHEWREGIGFFFSINVFCTSAYMLCGNH